MAEIGLVKFATIALHVGQAALPAYRSKFSKHQFTQPQLLAVLCLMRYEDWTFREAEVRLAEHAELRAALGLRHAPDYTTVYRFLRRLDEAALEQTLSAVIQRLVPQPDLQATVAVDATGLAPGAISTFFVKRAKDRGEGFTWRHWLKWTMAVDVDRQLIVAQTARRGPTNDCATLRPLARAHCPGAGGCRVRQRAQSSAYSPDLAGAERHSSEAGRGGVADSWDTRPDARGVSHGALSPARTYREPHLRGQTQAFRSSTGPLSSDAMPAGVTVGHRIQYLPPVVVRVACAPKDVNRAR